MSYYVYENWQQKGRGNRETLVHLNSCGDCQDGKGKHKNAGDKNGKWHPAFATFDEAMTAAKAIAITARPCLKCLKHMTSK